jgi:hypothetical protein
MEGRDGPSLSDTNLDEMTSMIKVLAGGKALIRECSVFFLQCKREGAEGRVQARLLGRLLTELMRSLCRNTKTSCPCPSLTAPNATLPLAHSAHSHNNMLGTPHSYQLPPYFLQHLLAIY